MAPVLKGLPGAVWAGVGTEHNCEVEIDWLVGAIAYEGLDLSAFRIEPGLKVSNIDKSGSLS